MVLLTASCIGFLNCINFHFSLQAYIQIRWCSKEHDLIAMWCGSCLTWLLNEVVTLTKFILRLLICCTIKIWMGWLYWSNYNQIYAKLCIVELLTELVFNGQLLGWRGEIKNVRVLYCQVMTIKCLMDSLVRLLPVEMAKLIVLLLAEVSIWRLLTCRKILWLIWTHTICLTHSVKWWQCITCAQ